MAVSPTGAGDDVVAQGLIARQERAVVAAAFDEGVDGVAVGGDRGDADFAVFVAQIMALVHAARAAPGGFAPGELGVLDGHGDVADSVAVQTNVVGDAAVGTKRRGEDKADLPLLEDVGGAVVKASFWTSPGYQRHAEGGAIEIGRLAGVADVKLDVIRSSDGEKVFGSRSFRTQEGGQHGVNSDLVHTDGRGSERAQYKKMPHENEQYTHEEGVDHQSR